MDNMFGKEACLMRGALFSDCGQYRYSLTRRWAEGPAMCFILLNPSTADCTSDDPTIRRCVAFSKREGAGALEVVNLFAFRATDPAELWQTVKPELAEQDAKAISAALGRAAKVVVAWGASIRSGRWIGDPVADEVLELIAGAGLTPYCLGTTKEGHPRHPLYCKRGEALVPFRGGARG